MNIESFVQKTSNKFYKAGIKNSRREVRLLLEDTLGITLEKQINEPTSLINLSHLKKLNKMVQRRLNKEPLSRITKKASFRKIDLELNNYTFIPRSDSETTVEVFLNLCKKKKPKNILDIGIGSGSLLISILLELSETKGVGTDICYETIYLAKKNAIVYGLKNRIELVCTNWGNSFKTKSFDALISNPPYIKSNKIDKLDVEVSKYEPRVALDGGTSGVSAYERILVDASNILLNNALVVLEIGYNQSEEVLNIMKFNGIKNLEVHKDLNRNTRCISGYYKK